MENWVYIIYSESKGSFYKGQTDNLQYRIHRHNMGWEKATKNGIPWTLIWALKTNNRSSALVLERKLKNLSKKRLMEFMKKYPGDLEGPDVTQKA